MDKIREALKIARHDLRWCYKNEGIISGSRMVYWSWDSFFASFGALSLGDFEIVKKNLSLYLRYQKQNGNLPKRIANPWYAWRFVGIPIKENPTNQRPTYANSYYTALSLTQDTTFIIALAEYLEKSHDKMFAREAYPKLKKILDFLQSQEDEHGLLKEGIGGGWAESVLKRGEISFSNICYTQAYFCMAKISRTLKFKQEALKYQKRGELLRQKVNIIIWSDEDGGYYSDWIGHKRHHHFATDSNLLAILWDIADEEQTKKIQHKINELSLEDEIPIKLAYNKYSFWRIFIFNRIGGMKDYHVGFSWTWLGCVDVLVRLKLNQKSQALKNLQKIAQVIVRDQTVHETYKHGQAVSTLFYKSENPWAWGAGLFVYACKEAGITLENQSN
jgi:glycogen debranching enzyme